MVKKGQLGVWSGSIAHVQMYTLCYTHIRTVYISGLEISHTKKYSVLRGADRRSIPAMSCMILQGLGAKAPRKYDRPVRSG